MCILAEFATATVTVPHTLLIPGDVQGTGEDALTDVITGALNDRRLDIYITAHHGSSGTTTSEFLASARPRLAINSAGLNNRYGHPNSETLDRLTAAGCTYLTLYETGAVTMDFSQSEIRITTYLSCY